MQVAENTFTNYLLVNIVACKYSMQLPNHCHCAMNRKYEILITVDSIGQ